MDDALKTRSIKRLNVETWLFAPPLSKFLATRLTRRRSLTDAAVCMDLINESWFNIAVISYVIFYCSNTTAFHV